jgi:hypothetical protein
MAAATLLAAGCTLVEPLDGLTGGDAAQGPEGGDASVASDAVSDVASQDARADSTPVDGAVDAKKAGDAGDAGSPDAHATLDGSHDGAADAGVTYAQTVLADSPLAYWRLDEATGTTAHDASGNGNDATYVGGVTLGAPGALVGDPDKAITLDGTTGYVDAGNRFAFAQNAPFTLECWGNPASLTQQYPRLMARETDAAPRSGYLVFVRQPTASDLATLSLERWSGNTQQSCPSAQAITLAWHHFVATYDGATSRVYLDGAQVATQPSADSIPTIVASFLVGRSAFDTNMFVGDVDEVAVYGAALPAARVAAHYHASGR